MTLRIMKSLQERAERTTITAADIAEVAREEIGRILPIAPLPITLPAKPKVLLIVGVNGTGKTTSTAKLAHFFKRNRHSVLLAAADTFRAAAIEQDFGIWAERLGVEMIRGQYNADPAALCYEAYEAADRRNIEFLICDTRGPVAHKKQFDGGTRRSLKRSIARHDPKAATLLVVDATTGSNALAQAREFHQSVGLTGLIVTKLDGSGKGGIVIANPDGRCRDSRDAFGTGEKLEGAQAVRWPGVYRADGLGEQSSSEGHASACPKPLPVEPQKNGTCGSTSLRAGQLAP